jgi:putative tricarboxylic transport membrane protein
MMREPGSEPHQIDRAGLVIAAILVFLAGVLWREAYTMGGTVNYGVGPTAALKVVAGGLLLLALATAWSAFRSAGETPEPMDARPVWMIMAGCAVMIIFIQYGVGFIPATTVLFAATATAFGRRKIPVDLAIGFVLATLIYLLFSKLLTLTLPQGPLERLLG